MTLPQSTRIAGLALAATLVTPLAQAQSPTQPSGLYLGLATGYNKLDNQTISRADTPFGPQPGGNIKTDDGVAVLFAVGWSGLPYHLRAELEVGQRRNQFTQGTAGALKSATARGREDKTSVFANLYYDFDAPVAGVAPYLGVGIGSVESKWNDLVLFNDVESVRINHSIRKTAYQAILGATFGQGWVPGLTFLAEYRYMALQSGDTGYTGRVERSRFGSFPTTAHVDANRNHSLLVGVRYAFR